MNQRRCGVIPVPRLASVVLALAILGAGEVASAGNSEGIFLGEQAVLSGGAVRALVSDGSATIYNPAGLGTIKTNILNVSLSAFQFRTQKLNDAYVREDVGEYSIQGSQLTPLPTSIAFSRPFVDDWTLGFGIFTKSFKNTTFSVKGDTEMNAALFETDVELQVREDIFRAGGGLGKRFSDKVSFGFSIAAEVASRAVNSSISLDATAESASSSRLETTSSRQTVLGLTGIVGTMVEFADYWTFGGVIELPTFRVYEHNRARSSSLFVENANGETQTYESTEDEQASVQDTALLLNFIRVHASFAYEKGPWTVSLEGDLSLENSFQLDSVLRGVWNIRAGLQYTTPKDVIFGFGVFTDRAQDLQTFESTFGDYQFTGVSSAVRFQNRHQLEQEDGGSRDLVFSTTIGLRYAYGSNEFEPKFLAEDGETSSRELPVSDKFAHELTLYVASAFEF